METLGVTGSVLDGNQHAARQAAARVAQASTVSSLGEQLASLGQAHEKAEVEQEKLTRAQAEAEALLVPASEYKHLRDCSEELNAAQAKLDAVATALEFHLEPKASVRVAGTQISGDVHQTVIARTDIEIEGVGRITVVPGGADLETLAIERDRKRDELTSLLRALNAESLAAVEERMRLQAQRKAEAKASEAVVAALAPKGLARLSTEIATQAAKLLEAKQALEAMPPALASDAAKSSVDQAESEETAARAALETVSRALNEAKVDVGNAQTEVRAAKEEIAALKATLGDPGRARKKIDANAALTDALAQQATAQHRIDELALRLQAVNLPVLEQDVERLERSAKEAEAAHSKRANVITRLEVELETKGALGQEEAAADMEGDLGHAERRCAELARRARALDHLLNLLSAKRADLVRRLRVPLQKHLNHYLQILFPGAEVEVGDDLSPGRIVRPGIRGTESGEFGGLSVGTREQMGVIARLAYADLLKEAGKPTLLILDDALVHTDDERLDQMKRVLYDGASRHQILIFSCHRDAWRDLGVVPRDIL